jgi:hypothetical protein
MAVLMTLAFAGANYLRWGVFAGSDLQARNFTAAYRAILRIKPDKPIPFVPVTRDMLQKAYAVSPHMRKLRDYLEQDAVNQSALWRHVQNVPPGDYSGGYFVTCLQDAVERAGYYRDGPKTEEFYGRIVQELNEAEHAGLLDTHWLPPGASWVTHPYPETYLPNLLHSWRALWHHSWSTVWQAGPAPLDAWAPPETQALFDRVARRGLMPSLHCGARNTARVRMWIAFNFVMEPVLAFAFLISAMVAVRARGHEPLAYYLVPGISFAGYGLAAFVVFAIIDASIIPARDYLFPGILAFVIACSWLSAEGVRLLCLARVRSSRRHNYTPKPRSAGTYIVAAGCLVMGVALLAQWGYGKYSPADPMEEVGRLEKVSGEEISGWARLRNDPTTPAVIEVSVDGKPVATIVADLPRKDLAEANVGNGRHGFSLPTPTVVKDGNTHAIRAKVVGTGYELADSPFTVTLDPPALAK